MTQNIEVTQTEFHDGQLLPMDSIAVCPASDEDVAQLIRLIPISMAAEVARWAAWRALGYDATPASDCAQSHPAANRGSEFL